MKTLILTALAFIVCLQLQSQPIELQRMKNTFYRAKIDLANREILINRVGTGEIEIRFSFPSEYFSKSAYMLVQPSIVFGGTKRPLQQIMIQGDNADGDYQTISYRKGGGGTASCFVKYEEEMKNAAMVQLDISVFYNPSDDIRQKVYFQKEIPVFFITPEVKVVKNNPKNTTSNTKKDSVVKKDVVIANTNETTKDIAQNQTSSTANNTVVVTQIPKNENDTNVIAPIVLDEKFADLQKKLNEANQLASTQQYQQAIDLLEVERTLYKNTNKNEELEIVENQLANTFEQASRYDKAIDVYISLLTQYEKKANKPRITQTRQRMALLYYKLNDYKKSELLFENIVSNDTISKKYLAENNNNLAIVLCEGNNFDKANALFTGALEFYKNEGDATSESKVLNNMANTFYYQNQFETAVKYYQQALQIKQNQQDTKGIAICNYNLGNASVKWGKSQDAKNYFEKCLQYAKQAKLTELVSLAYLHLAEIQSETSPSEATDNYQKFAASTFLTSYKNKVVFEFIVSENVEISALLNELNQTKLNLIAQTAIADAQQREISLLETDKKLKTESIKKKNIMLISLLILLLFVLIMTYLVYRQYKFKKKANAQLAEQNEIINQANEEVRTQNEILFQQKEEITAQMEEIDTQKNIISEQNTQMIDSINYALKIQSAVLLPLEQLNQLLPNNFLIYRPCQIVSGDFYWARKVQHYIYFTVADCTGHGVPGGFMSMLSMSFLNDSVTESHIVQPSDLVNLMREFIKQSLHQSGKMWEQKDGLDIALCRLNTHNQMLEFTGAYNSLYVFRNSELIEIKADRMPVAIYPKENSFTNHSFQLVEGDMIYLFSDGYASQLRAETYEKFKTKRFNLLLTQIHERPLNEQKEILSKTLDEWQGSAEQTDDITVLGVKI